MVIFENRYLKRRLKNDNFFCLLQDAAILLWPLNRNYHCLKYGFFSLYNMWTNIQASFKQFPGVFRTLLTIKVSRIHLDPEMHQRVNILFYNFLKQDPPKVEQYFVNITNITHYFDLVLSCKKIRKFTKKNNKKKKKWCKIITIENIFHIYLKVGFHSSFFLQAGSDRNRNGNLYAHEET